MALSARIHRSIRRSFAGLGAAGALAVAAAAAAEPAVVPGPEVTTSAAAEVWEGRFCTAARCKRSPASVWGATASFGAAVVLTGWLARRPQPRAD